MRSHLLCALFGIALLAGCSASPSRKVAPESQKRKTASCVGNNGECTSSADCCGAYMMCGQDYHCHDTYGTGWCSADAGATCKTDKDCCDSLRCGRTSSSQEYGDCY